MEAQPRLTNLSIRNYRSIEGWLHIALPVREPLVLVGENNAGKSNVLRALALLFGDFWPGSHKPEDHEYFGRSPEGNEIKVIARVDGITCPQGCAESWVQSITWKYAPDDDEVCEFTRSTDNCMHTWMSNEVRQALYCMSVGVNRDLSWQLSYGSKWTTLSKLMRRFHDRLISDPDRVEKLKQIFGSLVETFHEVDEFQLFGASLKQAFADFGGNLSYGLDIDFSAYDASNYFRSLRIFPHVDGEARTYEELGTGQEQVLAMSFAYAYAQAFGGDGLILTIEEPESHLHPLAQQWLARKVRRLAAAGVQVIVTTHSPYFLDLARPWTTVLVRREGEAFGTTATQYTAEELAARLVELGAPAERTSATSVGPHYESAATYETLGGFFSRACVLVEGATESFGLPILLERAGLELLERGIAVIPVEGIANMAKWVRLYRAYGIPVYPILDTDSNDAAKAAQARAAAIDVLSALGESGEVGEPAGPLTVTASYARLDPNYERAMRHLFGDVYETLEAEASETVGTSKQLKARFCARKVPGDDESPEAWEQIQDLAAAIGQRAPEAQAREPSDGAVSPPAVPNISRRTLQAPR